MDKETESVVNKCSEYGNAYVLTVDTDNSLWVATDCGLLHYTDQAQALYNSSNTSLTEDAVFKQESIGFQTKSYSLSSRKYMFADRIG